MPFKVVLDACVLFPSRVRETLTYAAQRKLYQLYWSSRILDEAIGALLRQRNPPTSVTAVRANLEEAFPEAMVTDYEFLIDSMPNHPKDRHVVAVAIKAGAELIVTSNLRDF